MSQRQRESGLLLHVTSLPSDQGIGNFGPAAYRFVHFLSRTRQQLWQVLPLGPTGYGNSPYQSFSAFAGNPLLISLEALASEGLLDTADLLTSAAFPADTVAFDEVALQQTRLLGEAFERFRSPAFSNQQAELAL